jgi:hypothetical protein
MSLQAQAAAAIATMKAAKKSADKLHTTIYRELDRLDLLSQRLERQGKAKQAAKVDREWNRLHDLADSLGDILF